MSYEAFNWLWGKSADEMLSGRGHEDLERMASRLQELGGPVLARETNDFLQFLADLDGEIERRAERLRDIWRAVDGYDSADWGEDSFQKALVGYLASLQPTSQEEDRKEE